MASVPLLLSKGCPMQWHWQDYKREELVLVRAGEQERASAKRGITRLGYAGKHGATTAERLHNAVETGRLSWDVMKSLSSWCNSESKYEAGVEPAREVSRALFNEHVLPRLTPFRGDGVTERIARDRFDEFAKAARILDEVPARDQTGQSPLGSTKALSEAGSATITYKRRAIPDYRALVNAYSDEDLASPFRSTVPLLAYWADPTLRLSEFTAALQIDEVAVSELAFEYMVPVEAGTGKESHTDLMLRSQPRTVAIEAKYTEPKYQTVRDWLGPAASANRTLVLGGWLSLIKQATGSALEVPDVLDCTYQLVHRTASACQPGSREQSVVYLCFDHTDRLLDHHLDQLSCLSHLIRRPERISFCLFAVGLKKTPEYQALQDAWTAGCRDLSAEVKDGLISRALLEFGVPIVRRI